jgi:hypothetical protein
MDTWMPTESGLFQLHRDGTATPITSYVKRDSSVSEQLAQLENVLGWLPEQVIAAAFDQVNENKYTAPNDIMPVGPGCLLAPSPVKMSVLLAPGEAGSGPVRSYLWPVLDSNGQLELEAGEELLDRRSVKPLGDWHYATATHAHMTTRRIVTIGDLHLPLATRDDYKLTLGLVSPALMDAVAAIRQIGRIGQNAHRKWVHHVRYEWLTSVTKVATEKAQKKLFGGVGPEHTSWWYRGEIRWPNGRSGLIQMGSFSDDRLESLRDPDELARKTADFERLLKDAIRRNGLGWDKTESTVRDINRGRYTTEVFSVNPSAGYTIPADIAHT